MYFHDHLYAFSAQIVGAKRWFIFRRPRSMREPHGAPCPDKIKIPRGLDGWEATASGIRQRITNALLGVKCNTLSWFERKFLKQQKQYDNMKKHGIFFECTQGPGDVMLVPAGASHAVLNLGDSVSIAFQQRYRAARKL